MREIELVSERHCLGMAGTVRYASLHGLPRAKDRFEQAKVADLAICTFIDGLAQWT